MAVKCKIIKGKEVCPKPDLFMSGYLGKGPFQEDVLPISLGVGLWADDPNVPSNITESAFRVSRWFDISGNSNDFVQATGADQGLRTGSEIAFDGSSEFMNTPITPFAGDLSGEVIFILNDLRGAGTTNQPLTFNDNASDDNFIRFGLNGPNNIEITTQAGAGANSVVFGAGVRDTTVMYSFSSDGSAYNVEENGVNSANSAGVDNGDWIGDNASLDTFAIGALDRLTPFFYNSGFETVLYFNRQLTAAERLQITTFLNDKFSIF